MGSIYSNKGGCKEDHSHQSQIISQLSVKLIAILFSYHTAKNLMSTFFKPFTVWKSLRRPKNSCDIFFLSLLQQYVSKDWSLSFLSFLPLNPTPPHDPPPSALLPLSSFTCRQDFQLSGPDSSGPPSSSSWWPSRCMWVTPESLITSTTGATSWWGCCREPSLLCSMWVSKATNFIQGGKHCRISEFLIDISTI